MNETLNYQRAYPMITNNEFEQDDGWHQEIYKKYGYESRHKTPTYFGPYLLLQTLGEGEFAKVKAGVHVETEQDVAIKLIKKEHVRQASLETKLEREISVLKSVCHPHIVSLYEVLDIKNYIGIVLQRAFGGELFDYILKHHYLQENEAKRLFAQLISGVHYMHQKHIVHRDLKLENLLLSKDRDIIITDFGFANRFKLEHQDLMVTSCGSPCYAAPELVINDDENIHYVGTAVDIWSCGVILFAMLCGYLPFDDDPNNPQGANIHLLYKYILSTPLELPTSMSEEAKDLLKRMLVPDPSKRCTMDEIRSHPWLEDYHDLLYKSIKELESITSDARLSISVSQTNNLSESRDQEHGVICTTQSIEDIPSLVVNEEDDEEQSHPSTPEEKRDVFEQEKSNSLFQSKFFSAISRHVSVRKTSPTPIRSQSAQPRQRTMSDTQDRKQPKLTILPSVSEQTIMTQKKASKGKKFKNWFKRNSKHTNNDNNINNNNNTYERFNLPERPVSSIHPIRAMSIGKPLGSYAADFNDSKLRIHKGAVDQDALTSKAPNEILFTIKDALKSMGISMKRVHDFKIKCIRPSKHHQPKRNSLKLFFNNNNNRHEESIYGEQGVDTAEEVQFTVELSKIENLPGLYVVDIRRVRGNIWAYKFLYHTLLNLLDLRQGGYMAHRRVSSVQEEEENNRSSYLTTSTHSTNDFF
ncbi:hypothetical protein G6F37_002754 [Rhizopus arrhizus]|nr:hypothetical protein G6F38_006127 [Rhizopus arrhizus]KAG1161790.1 hypothetical protein G6F37_002754 [Rhizopus arrhizus]